MQRTQAGQFFGPIALAWLASHFGGWSATLWAMLAFAAGGALCGFAIARIERSMRALESAGSQEAPCDKSTSAKSARATGCRTPTT